VYDDIDIPNELVDCGPVEDVSLAVFSLVPPEFARIQPSPRHR
jgi:hypothetical protein